jgi:hypothetical protein
VLNAVLAGYGLVAYPIPAGTNDMTVDIRLRQDRLVAAGQSITFTIEPDSSTCFDADTVLTFERLCEQVSIQPDRSGILALSARAETGGVVPGIQQYYVGGVAFGPAISFPVTAGKTYSVRIGIPREAAPTRIVLDTSIE